MNLLLVFIYLLVLLHLFLVLLLEELSQRISEDTIQEMDKFYNVL